jgi:hypothetical protein
MNIVDGKSTTLTEKGRQDPTIHGANDFFCDFRFIWKVTAKRGVSSQHYFE